MKNEIKLSIVLCILEFLLFPVYVKGSPPIYQGWHSIANQNYTADTRYTAIEFSLPSLTTLYLIDDIDPSVTSLHNIWKDLRFTGSIGNTLVTDFQIDRSFNSQSRVKLNRLTLAYTQLRLEPELFFYEPYAGSNRTEINLTDSSILFYSDQPRFTALVPLAITTQAGTTNTNTLKGLSTLVDTTTRINVAPGTTLTFEDCGSLQSSDKSYWLAFREGSDITLTGSTLDFYHSRVQFRNSTATVTGSGTIQVRGFGTWIEMDDLSMDDSTLSMTDYSRLDISGTLSLDDSNVSITGSGELTAFETVVNGAVQWRSPDKSGYFSTQVLLSGSTGASSITLDDFNLFQVDTLYLDSSLAIMLDGYSSLRINDGLYFRGGTINVDGWANLVLAGAVQGQGRYGSIVLGAGGTFSITETGLFEMSAGATLANANEIRVKGKFGGSGTVSGDGTTYILNNGSLSPGNEVTIGTLDPIGTLTFENLVYFHNALGLSYRDHIFDGGFYDTDLKISSGSAQNDLIQYVDNDVDIINMHGIRVSVLDSPSADDLDGKYFTVIASKNAGAAGTILDGGQDPIIIEDASVPALINFSVQDLNTNGHPDITLVASKLSYAQVAATPTLLGRSQTHVSGSTHTTPVITANHKTSVAMIALAASMGHTASQTALQFLTNGQVASHIDTFHAEPFASYMTVGIEHCHTMMGRILDHAIPESKNRLWSEFFWGNGKIDGENGVNSYRHSHSGILIGFDTVFTGTGRAGIYGGLSRQSLDEHDALVQDIKGNTLNLGVYFKTGWIRNWEISSILGYGYGQHDSKRHVNLGTYQDLHEADFNSHQVYAGIRGWYRGWNIKGISLGPDFGTHYVYYHQKSMSEQGDGLSLAVDPANAMAIVSSVGMAAEAGTLFEKFNLTPTGFIRFEHDWYADKNNTHEIKAGLTDQPGNRAFFVGQNRGPQTVTAGLGLTAKFAKNTSLNIAGSYGWHSYGQDYDLKAGFQISW